MHSEVVFPQTHPTMKLPQNNMTPPRSLLAACAVCLLSAIPLSAQVSSPVVDADKEKTIELSVYKVTSTQDTGYVSKLATPFKTKQQIVDIPQSITVVTRDLIDDIGEFDLVDEEVDDIPLILLVNSHSSCAQVIE